VRVVVALCVCLSAATAARAIGVEKLLGGGRLVAYAPSGWTPSRTRASSRGLRADAESLRRVGFRAVATYGAGPALAPVCRFFKRRGFRTVLVGVWDPRDRVELRRAVHLRRCADGYVVGSEGLTFGRYTRADLDAAIAFVRRRSGRPVTTREPLGAYLDDPTLVRAGDWIFPSIQPWYAGKRDAQDACGWTIFAYRDLAERAPAGIPTVIGETGLPTEGALATSEHYQRAFFLCLESRQVAFAHFEAFDQPWKRDDAVAPHWGLFRADGTPKLWAGQQLRPTITARRAGRAVRGRVGNGPLRPLRVVVYVEDTGLWTPRPPVRVDRRGKWRVRVPSDRAAAAYVVSAAWTPPPPMARLPAVDRAQVYARQDVPPL